MASSGPSTGCTRDDVFRSGRQSGARRWWIHGGAGAGARDGLNGEDVRQYKISVSSAAKRFKVYPRLARERGWEGTAEIAIDTSSLSAAPEIVLLHSSGKKLLDEQALEMVSSAGSCGFSSGWAQRAGFFVLSCRFSSVWMTSSEWRQYVFVQFEMAALSVRKIRLEA